MNNSSLNPKIKARITYLNKKEKEELISIILRKDDTERKNNIKIASLKENISILKLQVTEKSNAIIHLNLNRNILTKVNKDLTDEVYNLNDKLNRTYKYLFASLIINLIGIIAFILV